MADEHLPDNVWLRAYVGRACVTLSVEPAEAAWRFLVLRERKPLAGERASVEPIRVHSIAAALSVFEGLVRMELFR